MCWKAEHFVFATIKYSLATYTTLHFRGWKRVMRARDAGWFWGALKVLRSTSQLSPTSLNKTLCEYCTVQRVSASESHSCKKNFFWLFQIIFRFASCLFSGKHLKVSVQMRSHLQTQKFHGIAKFQSEWQIYHRAGISQEIWFKFFSLKIWKSFYINVFNVKSSFPVCNKYCSFFQAKIS